MKYLLVILLLLAGCQPREDAKLRSQLENAQRELRYEREAAASVSLALPQTPDPRINELEQKIDELSAKLHEPTPAEMPDLDKKLRDWVAELRIAAEDRGRLEQKLADLEKQLKASPQPPERSVVMPPPSSLNWLDSLPAGKSESQRTGKPALIHFTSGDNCQACVIMDRDVFTDATVRSELSSYVLVKIDVASLSDDSKARWAVGTLPADDVLTPDWLTRHRITFTLDPQEFADQLTDGVGWAKTKRRTNTAVQQQPVQTVSQPTERVVYIQSNGSTGGIVGGSLEPLQTYRSPVYYQQPTYYTPTYYTRPTLFPRYYGSGTTVCGPNGCYTQ